MITSSVTVDRQPGPKTVQHCSAYTKPNDLNIIITVKKY